MPDDDRKTENLTIRLLREIQRTLAAQDVHLGGLREEIEQLRDDMQRGFAGVDSRFTAMRNEMRAAINQQHAVLANHSVLIDTIDERLRELEETMKG